MVEPILDSKRDIRSQIYYRGNKNSLKKGTWDDRVAQNWMGCTKSHISFVRQNHRDVEKYDQAVEDIYAASYSLTKLEEYYGTGDNLFDLFYKSYQDVVRFGTELTIARCKEILQFVKYPEGKDLPYVEFTYDQLFGLAKYKTIQEYPRHYLMYYEIINEFDLKLDSKDKKLHAFQYMQEYLSPQIYQEGDQRDVTVLDTALNVMVSLVKPRVAKIVWDIILNGPQHRLGKVNNTYCKAGSKQTDFWIKLGSGISPDIQDEVSRDFQRLKYLYKREFEMPPITESGMNEEYHTQLIVQEDPKKPRFAYESNPIKDYIGYPGMDVLHALFQCWPWVQCGRKRESKQDMILDKHRWMETRKVFEHNINRGREMKSSDLTKCTEHLNMRTGRQLVYTLLCRLLKQFPNPQVTEDILWEWVTNTYDQLFDTPIIVSHNEELGLFYPKHGQTQGVPGSFHIMTFELAAANLQAVLDSGLEYRDAILSIQNNGDDGTGPEIAEPRYKELIELLSQPGVYNEEKSFSTRINGSLEFCKTIYYSTNEQLVTGYRFSTLYKLTNNVWELAYVSNIGFEHENELFTWFTEFIHPTLNAEWDKGEYIAFKRSYTYLHDMEYQRYVQQLQIIRQRNAVDKMILADQELIPDMLQMWVPKTWLPLVRVTTEYTVEEGNTIIYSDMKKLRQYLQESIGPFMPGDLLDATPEDRKAYLTILGCGISHFPIHTVEVGSIEQGIEPCTVNVFEPSSNAKIQLGMTENAIVLIEPRVNWWQEQTTTTESILRSNERMIRCKMIKKTIDEQIYKVAQGEITTNMVGTIMCRLNQ